MSVITFYALGVNSGIKPQTICWL